MREKVCVRESMREQVEEGMHVYEGRKDGSSEERKYVPVSEQGEGTKVLKEERP